MYAEALASPLCEAVHLTEVTAPASDPAKFECDAFLPDVESFEGGGKFKLYASSGTIRAEDGAGAQFL